MKNYQKHPLNFLPVISEEEKEVLKSQLQNNGYDPDFPIILYEGKILDGCQRYTICKELGIEPIFTEFKGTEEEAFIKVINATTRRNLTARQKAGIVLKKKEYMKKFEDDAKKRQGKRTDLEEGDNIPAPDTGKLSKYEREAKTQAAKAAGTNRKALEDVEFVEKELGEEGVDKVISNEITKADIDKMREVKKPEEEKTNPFFKKTSSAATSLANKLQTLLQKEEIPKTAADFNYINSMNHALYRIIALSGQAGIDVRTVWEKLAERHGIEIKTPSHLKKAKSFDIEDVPFEEIKPKKK